MAVDEDFQDTVKQYKTIGKEKMTLNERINRRRALDKMGIPDFQEFVEQRVVEDSIMMSSPSCGTNSNKPLERQAAEILQLNIGL
jgi:hypothetical protein